MADDDGDLKVDQAGGVLRLTLDRPDAANAITPDQRNRLVEQLDGAASRVDVRVVVLTATGRHFCTGADLRAAAGGNGAQQRHGDHGHDTAGGDSGPPSRPVNAPERVVGDVSRMLQRGAQRLISAVLDCDKPVIAAVNGTAAGLGAHLALACDLVVAADTARFIEVFVRRGLVVDAGGAWLLPRLVGLHKAKELAFFGDDLPAADALGLGLVNRVVPADELDAAVDAWATRLAAGPTRAIALTKQLLNRSLDSDRTTAFHDEAVAQELNMGTEDANEGVRAFVERRSPDYHGW
jgi:2-(1,2-epoxy-1,2-dihydrophenyl)acetyl-CoA isomerase